MKNLVSLNLAGDSLTMLPSSISRLSNLQNLSLSYNQLTSLPNGISKLAKLSTLNIEMNKIGVLPDAFGKLKSLTQLIATGNPIVRLPNSFSQLRILTTFHMAHGNLKDLPDDFGLLGNLTTLDLSDNFITHLPTSFTQLKNLTSLIINNNLLENLPPDLGGLTKLKYADLNFNNIKTLPASIGLLGNLEELNLYGNSLVKLPDELGNLASLKKIDLSNLNDKQKNGSYSYREIYRKDDPKPNRVYGSNTFTTLPADLSKWTELKSISLNFNKMLDGNELFKSLFSIGGKNFSTQLQNIGVEKLPTEGWGDFKVRELNLNNNLIQTIPADIINAPYLTAIVMNNNRLPLKPINLNAKTENKYQTLLWFNEFGLIPLSALPRVDSMALAYLEKSTSHYYRNEFAEMVKAVKAAYEISPAIANSKAASGSLGEAKFKTGDYKGAIETLTLAINLDTAGFIRIMNFIQPDFEFRAQSFLKIGDTLSAIKDYETLSRRFNVNKWGTMALLYKQMGDDQNAKKAFDSGKKSYQEILDSKFNQNQDMTAYKLSLLELLIVAEDFRAAADYAQKISEEVIGDGNKILHHYLKTSARLGLGAKIDVAAIAEVLKTNRKQVSGWGFDLFYSWLAQTKINNERVKELRLLTDSLTK